MRGLAALLLRLSLCAGLAGLTALAGLTGDALAAATPTEAKQPSGAVRAGVPASQPVPRHAGPSLSPASRTAAATGSRAAKPHPPGHHPTVAPAVSRPVVAPLAGGPARPERPPPASPPLRANPPLHATPPLHANPPLRANNDNRIAAARELYQAGRYAEVPTALVKLLAESPLTAPQLAAVYELLASAYVALGQTELAIRCFSEVLSRRPAFALDPVRVSPKIRAALDQARRESRPPIAPPPAHQPM